jgi:UDP-glucose 4-epimerase
VKWGPLVVGDIGDRALVRKTVKRFGIRATVHFAAHAYVGESVEQPPKYFDNNVSKTLALLELLDASVDKFVFSCSCATCGIPWVLPIAEHHRQLPTNLYGASKLFLENVLYWYERAYGDPPALIADPQLGRSLLGWTLRRSDLLTIALGLAVAPENAPQAISAAGRTRE